ncbi:PREDICTED: uncharacterized protein LOC108749790 isoform X2 [Trachymyrmex septentrionalis]|uniref:uncharacterized protein LOC108749790 isoform X2 n=1 Tax=Trachymyrmex septentrionalis TaxID=34720 RepID=UPI00084F76A5|nr:PREDICTED: uncharacterized protein LOC108749790 isoform X2 [Trachymyrmex septentrionalis]
MRYVESTNGRDVSSWVTAVSSFTTFGGRDPNCFRYNAIFRRIWANDKGTRRVDSRFFSATIGSSIINTHIKIISLYQVGPAEAIDAYRHTRDALIRTSVKIQSYNVRYFKENLRG